MEDCWLQSAWTKPTNTWISCVFYLWFVLWVWSFYFWDFISEAVQLSHLTSVLWFIWSHKSMISAWRDLFPAFLRLYSAKCFCISRAGRDINFYWALSSPIPCSHRFSTQAKRSHFCLHVHLLIFWPKSQVGILWWNIWKVSKNYLEKSKRHTQR